MAQWLSWLERRPVTAEVAGSSPAWVALWDLSSAGRASALQAEGHRFEPYRSHFYSLWYFADVAQLAEQLICNQQVIGSSPIIGFTILYCVNGQIPEWPKGTDCKSAANCFGGSNPPLPICFNFISRGGAVWKLVGLITRRSQVQILPPQLSCPVSSVGRAED